MEQLTINNYNEAEKNALLRFPNRTIQAFKPTTFGSLGYPTTILSMDELWRYHDVMQEGRFEANVSSLKSLSSQEYYAVKLVTDQIYAFGNISGRNVVSRSLISKRVIDSLFDKKSTILEIGPGCGYLGAMLVNDGHSYIAQEITQAFYIYQNHFWNSCFEDKVIECTENNIVNISSLSDNYIYHVPWWSWVDNDIEYPEIDLVVCNHVLSEMSSEALKYTFTKIKKIFERQKKGMILFEGFGTSKYKKHVQSVKELYDIGFEIIHNKHYFEDSVVIFALKNSVNTDNKARTKFNYKKLIPRSLSEVRVLVENMIKNNFLYDVEYMVVDSGISYDHSNDISINMLRDYYNERFDSESLNPKDEDFIRYISKLG